MTIGEAKNESVANSNETEDGEHGRVRAQTTFKTFYDVNEWGQKSDDKSRVK